MTASSAAGVARPWMVRLLLVSAGAMATLALSAGTADAGTQLVDDVVKQAHSVVKSTQKTLHRAPAKAAAPVRHTVSTVSTVSKAGRQVAAPVQRVAAPRNSSAARPATPVQRIPKTTPTKRVVHQAPAKKVVHLAVKPLASVKTRRVKLPAVKTVPLVTTIDSELLDPVLTPLLKPVLTPVLQVVAPVVAAVPGPLGPIVAAPLPVLPAQLTPITSGPTRSVPGLAPGMSTAATPVSAGPTPIVSGVGPTSPRPSPAEPARSTVRTTVVTTVSNAVDRVGDGPGSLVLGGLGSLVVTLAVGAGATGTATGGSTGSAGCALLERGLLGAAATSNRRFRDGLRIASWAFAKHPGFAPD